MTNASVGIVSIDLKNVVENVCERNKNELKIQLLYNHNNCKMCKDCDKNTEKICKDKLVHQKHVSNVRKTSVCSGCKHKLGIVNSYDTVFLCRDCHQSFRRNPATWLMWHSDLN